MGCGDGDCGGGDNHPTTLHQYFEKVLISGKVPVLGLRRRVEIRINRIESLNEEYVSGVETYLLLGGKSLHRTFYDVHSPRAKEILQKYQPKFA